MENVLKFHSKLVKEILCVCMSFSHSTYPHRVAELIFFILFCTIPIGFFRTLLLALPITSLNLTYHIYPEDGSNRFL
jgi:hypothetical protein